MPSKWRTVLIGLAASTARPAPPRPVMIGYLPAYAGLATLPAAAQDVIGTRCAGCGYIPQNGPATLARTARLARHQAAGVMVWDIVQDTDDARLARTAAAALGRVPVD